MALLTAPKIDTIEPPIINASPLVQLVPAALPIAGSVDPPALYPAGVGDEPRMFIKLPDDAAYENALMSFS
jgi:hypothetical protein